MWMATFADMATLLMSFFVLLIAFAEMEKQDSVMASEGQTGKNLGVQDEIPSEEAPPVNEGEAEDDALKKADADTDPVERIKSMICATMSGMTIGTSQKKPFNPFLGETLNFEFEDGSKLYLEHTTHHPPISNWLLTLPPDEGTYFYTLQTVT